MSASTSFSLLGGNCVRDRGPIGSFEPHAKIFLEPCQLDVALQTRRLVELEDQRRSWSSEEGKAAQGTVRYRGRLSLSRRTDPASCFFSFHKGFSTRPPPAS